VVIHRLMPRTERLGIGLRIENLFLDLLNQLRRAGYTTLERKIAILEAILTQVDSLRFFLQIAWEIKQIQDKHYLLIGKEIETLGKQIGGWRRDILKKLPQALREKENDRD
jgi:hypothetical protein